MVDKFELDSNIDRDEVLKEFQALDTTAPGQEAGSLAERVRLAHAKPKTPAIMIVLWVAISLVVVSALGMLVMNYATHISPGSIKVPSVVGQPAAAAKKVITDAGLRCVEQTAPSDKTTGTVISTNPEAGAKKKAGSDVVIVIAGKAAAPKKK